MEHSRQVVSQRSQRELRGYPSLSAGAELPQVALLLQHSKHRFHQGLASFGDSSSLPGAQLSPPPSVPDSSGLRTWLRPMVRARFPLCSSRARFGPAASWPAIPRCSASQLLLTVPGIAELSALQALARDPPERSPSPAVGQTRRLGRAPLLLRHLGAPPAPHQQMRPPPSA